jgi:hypothetical protein
MTEEEKVAEGFRIIQEYLANRRAKEQIPGTREYELEQMLRPVREKVAAMSQEERDALQARFQVKLAQIRAEMGYPPTDSEESGVAETDIVAMWRSYPIRVHLDQSECLNILKGSNFDPASIPVRNTDFGVRLKSPAGRFLVSLRAGDSRAAETGFWIVYELLDGTLPDEQAFELLADFHSADKSEPL